MPLTLAVGRTPWSAPGPLAGLFAVGKGSLLHLKSGTRGSRADQGVRPTAIFLAILLAALAAAGCGAARPNASERKVIVLGIDGMDPGFLERHWTALPNLARLRSQGDFKRLATTTPPQSPVAWSTFITGRDPAGHGIFDFVHRDPATLRPFSSMGETVESRRTLPIGPYALPLAGGEVLSYRKGTAFWQLLSARGVPATVLRMPTNFPPVRCQCQELAGMGTPDLQGTYGTFTFFTSDPAQAAREISGGRIVRIAPGSEVLLRIEGPVNSLRKDRRRTSAAIAAHIDAGAARFDLDDVRVILRPGEWSDWLPVRFPLIPGVATATGIVRIYLKQLSPHLQVYVSPVNIDPAAPDVPISVPGSYSRDLARHTGRFYTQGIAEDTAALRSGVFTLKEYLAQSRLVADEQIALLRHGLDQFHGGFFFLHFLGIDQNSHMLWGRHEAELLETYRMVDAAVGRVMERAAGALLVVMSDHGFAAFDRAVHLNTWLLREGFLAATPGPEELFARVDWSRTQAYALGLNAVYLNLRGRERHGTVAPGLPAQIALRVLSRRLRDWRDPETGAPVVADVDSPGENIPMAPDLIIGYNPPYRSSWQSAMGAVPDRIIEQNLDAWMGDHCVAARHVPGVLLVNRPIRAAAPQLADLPVTILNEFGLPRPTDMHGRVVF